MFVFVFPVDSSAPLFSSLSLPLDLFYTKLPSFYLLTIQFLISMQPSVLKVIRFPYLPCFADKAGLALKHTKIDSPSNLNKIEIHLEHAHVADP